MNAPADKTPKPATKPRADVAASESEPAAKPTAPDKADPNAAIRASLAAQSRIVTQPPAPIRRFQSP